MFDNLLQIQTGGNLQSILSFILVTFANDMAVVTPRHTAKVLQNVINNVLKAVAEWMEKTKLSLLIEKIEAIILTSQKGYDMPELKICGATI